MIGTRAQHSEQASTIGDAIVVDRRSLMMGAFSLALVSSSSLPQPAHAVFTPPPQGFRAQVDILDGYRFFYPEGWIGVTSSGNDCFLRNPRNIDECVFVDFSSPSSSRYNAVTDLGTPQDTANKILDQFLTKEFMSTRLGIKREGSVLSASSREGPEGRTYYDVAIRMTSYASRNPYVATQVRGASHARARAYTQFLWQQSAGRVGLLAGDAGMQYGDGRRVGRAL